MTSITVLAPTGTLGYGFGADAFARGMSLKPDVIAVDAGSTDPGPYYLGSGMPLVSRYSIKRELTELITAGLHAGIPVIVGSAGGSGSRQHVDGTVEIVREIATEKRLRFRLARIYADVEVGRVKHAITLGEVDQFEAGFPLTHGILDETVALVAQMGHEPIVEALRAGADVVIAGRACDDLVMAAYPIARGADPALAIHMGKILECGAFSAEPFAMDVMLGTVHADHFVLEPGSVERRASITSVAAHSLYERENPFYQGGPGHFLDLQHCKFDSVDERRVRVSGSRLIESTEIRVKLEGVRVAGYRTICVAGIRCPTMIRVINGVLEDVRNHALAYFAPAKPEITFHVYGRDGVMRHLEPQKRISSHELGVVIDVVAKDQDLARAVCHHISGSLLHLSFTGQVNTSGNLAFPYSPSEIDAGAAYEFSVYHLMRVSSPMELFPIHHEDL